MVPKTKGISPADIAQMIDLSAVRAESDDETVHKLVEVAHRFHVGLISVLPAQTALARGLLGDSDFVKLGGNVGFPSGGQTTTIKAAEARQLIELGCNELDMVISLSRLISGRSSEVLAEIIAVVEAAAGRPVKVILECYYLSADQIRLGCDLAIEAGATFVKTGTGWAPGGATLEDITIIKSHVGNRIGIKASGGIRSLDTLLSMYDLGASRFGVSLNSGRKILEDVYAPGI